jgi:hypothetical protein
MMMMIHWSPLASVVVHTVMFSQCWVHTVMFYMALVSNVIQRYGFGQVMAWQEDLGSHRAIPCWHCSMAPNISDRWMLQAYPCNCWVARTHWGRHSVSTTPQMWLKLAHQTKNKDTSLDQRQMVSLWDRYPVSPYNLSLSLKSVTSKPAPLLSA